MWFRDDFKFFLIIKLVIVFLLSCVKTDQYYCPAGTLDNLPIVKDTVYYSNSSGDEIWSVQNEISISDPYVYECRSKDGIFSDECGSEFCNSNSIVRGECILPTGELNSTKIQCINSVGLSIHFMGSYLYINLPFENNDSRYFNVETNFELGSRMYNELLHFRDTIDSSAWIREFFYHKQDGFVGLRFQDQEDFYIKDL